MAIVCDLCERPYNDDLPACPFCNIRAEQTGPSEGRGVAADSSSFGELSNPEMGGPESGHGRFEQQMEITPPGSSFPVPTRGPGKPPRAPRQASSRGGFLFGTFLTVVGIVLGAAGCFVAFLVLDLIRWPGAQAKTPSRGDDIKSQLTQAKAQLEQTTTQLKEAKAQLAQANALLRGATTRLRDAGIKDGGLNEGIGELAGKRDQLTKTVEAVAKVAGSTTSDHKTLVEAVNRLKRPEPRPEPRPQTVAEILKAGRTLLEADRFTDALTILRRKPSDALTADLLLERARARWLLYLDKRQRAQASPRKDDAALKEIHAELVKVKTADALFLRGQIEEELGDTEQARKIYDAGRQQYQEDAEQVQIFQNALDRLSTQPNLRPAKDSQSRATRRGDSLEARAAQVVLLATLLLAERPNKAAEPPEPGFKFYKALIAAQKHDYATAIDLLKQASAAHEQRRGLPHRRLNPKSDHREEIFPRCCWQLIAYWKIRALLHDADYPLPLLTEPADKQLAALRTLLNDRNKAETSLEAFKKGNKEILKLVAGVKTELAKVKFLTPKQQDPLTGLLNLVQAWKEEAQARQTAAAAETRARETLAAVAKGLGCLPRRADMLAAVGRRNPPSLPARAAETLKAGRSLLEEGRFADALALLDRRPSDAVTPELRMARAEARWLLYLQRQQQQRRKPRRDAADVKKVVAELDTLKAKSADALFLRAQVEEELGDFMEARKLYQDGLKRHAGQKRLFQNALDRLDTRPREVQPQGTGQTRALPRRPRGDAARAALRPAGAPNAPPTGAALPEEAGYKFFEAVKLAGEQHYVKAMAALQEAIKAHESRRASLPHKRLNPKSDPHQEIFPRCCLQLMAYWQVRARLQQQGYPLGSLKASLRAQVRPLGRLFGDLKESVTVAKGLKQQLEQAQAVTATQKILLTGLQAQLKDRATAKQTLQAVAKALGSRPVQAEMILSVDRLKATTCQSALALHTAISATLAKAGVLGGRTQQHLVQGVRALVKERDNALAARKEADADKQRATAARDKAEADTLAAVRARDSAEVDAKQAALARKQAEADRHAAVRARAKAERDRRQAVAARARAEAAGKQADRARQQAEANAEEEARARQQAEANTLAAVRARARAERNRRQALAARDKAEAERTSLRDARDKVEARRKELEETLDVVAGKLGSPTGRLDLIKAADRLRENRAPEQMLVVWLRLLRDRRHTILIDEAMKDTRRVLDSPATTAQTWEARAQALCIRGLALRNQGHCTQARATLLSALKIQGMPHHGDWRVSARTALQDLASPRNYYLDHARRLGEAGDFQQALVVLDLGLREFPRDGSLLALRSQAYLGAGRKQASVPLTADSIWVTKAREDAQNALATRAGRAEGSYAAGILAEYLGDLSAAEQRFRHALKEHPATDDVGGRYRLALVRVLSSRQTTAEGATAPADPDEPLPWKLVEALRLADEAIKAGHYEGYLLKARIHVGRRQWGKALKEYARGIKHALRPAYAGYADDLTAILAGHPLLRRPIPAREQDPDRAERYFALGLRHYFAAQYAAAETALAQSVRYNDQDARYWYYLGLALLRQDQGNTAVEFFREGKKLEGQNKPASSYVNRSLEKVQGKPRRLLDQYR